MAIADSNDTKPKSSPELRGQEAEEDEEAGDDDVPEDTPDDADDIIGARCRVSYCHDWGERRHHNAMVVCAEPSDDEPKVGLGQLRI